MRMSRSPQNGGFHRCTGGGPLREASRAMPVMASSPRRACSVSCAMVSIWARNDNGSSVPCRRCRRVRVFSNRTLRNCAASRQRSNLDVDAHFGQSLMGNLEEIGGAARNPTEEQKDRERYRCHGRPAATADHDLVSDVVMHVSEIDLEAERLATPECCGNVRRLHEAEPDLDAIHPVAEALDRMPLRRGHPWPPVGEDGHQDQPLVHDAVVSDV